MLGTQPAKPQRSPGQNYEGLEMGLRVEVEACRLLEHRVVSVCPGYVLVYNTYALPEGFQVLDIQGLPLRIDL